nr:unnamed protein product [Callosobruchus analis]
MTKNKGMYLDIQGTVTAQTIIDVTFRSAALAAFVNNWEVLEDFTGSDHQYIKFSVRNNADRHPINTMTQAGWTRKSKANRTPVYWWTPTIDALRKDALKLRRIAQRSRGRTDNGNAREQYRLAKKKLRKEIRSSKRQRWLSLCKQIDEVEWGLGFGIVMQRFGKQTDTTHGLQLAISKTEIVVLTRQRRFPEPLWVSLNDTTVEAKCAEKCMLI